MENYKKATRVGLRFNTNKGLLTTEQLWSLSIADLSSAIKEVKKKLVKNDDDELSFLEDVSNNQDTTEQLRFDILKDVYLTRKEELDNIKMEQTKRLNNQKILEIIADKKERNLRELDVDELEKLLIK